MRIIEPHIHTASRTTDDYEQMALAGIAAVVEPSFWSGTDRSAVESFEDYFCHLIGFETERARRHGIAHFSAIALNPKEANNLSLARRVVERLEGYLDREGVVALGEIGFDQITEAEEEIFRRQLRLGDAQKMPIIVHTPHQNKRVGTEKILQIIQEERVEQRRIVVDHNTEETLGMVLQLNVWAGLTIYPVTKLSPERAVRLLEKYGTDRVLINGSADWGYSDPLSVPKTVVLMRRSSSFSEEEIRRLVYDNPYAFYSQSPRFALEG